MGHVAQQGAGVADSSGGGLLGRQDVYADTGLR